jgi:ribosomal protein S27E
VSAYDRWATGGRYSTDRLWVECPDCEERTAVLAETEYGTTTWTPEECKTCGRAFLGDERWEDDEPPEPDDDPDDYDRC